MPHQFNSVYVHFVWKTKRRAPLITTSIEADLYACIVAKCESLGCMPITIGGIEDHVHLLLKLNHTITMSQLVGQAKGASSHMIRNLLRERGEENAYFRWQQGYGAFSVNYRELDRTIEYIHSQKEHHQTNQLIPMWEPD